MNGSPLRFGVVGCASIAWRRMLPALVANPDVRLVAIASRDAAKAARFCDRFGGEPVAGYGELLDRPDVDAVYVPLPPMIHTEWVERALLAGKHVLSEKPLAPTEAEATALVELASARDLALVESFMFLCHSQHVTVRKLVADGVIGELRNLTAEFAFPAKASADIRYVPDVGGGALTDIGVYPVRTALMYLGSDLEVVGSTLHFDPARGVDLGGTALLSTPNGVTAQLTFGMEHSYRSRYELWGSAGRVVVQWAYTPPPTHSPLIRIEQQDRIEELTLPPEDQFGNVVRAFVARVRDGIPSGLEGDAVLAQAALVDRVRASAVVRPSR
ncbi:Gfo/Idh/MocA family protein [Actinophytocola oryzae]|uniref:NDP-hexose-3-ketoreductase n=1 Tax=Actinophytocola oryzae TaxID=502181 RepID=A0A4R7UQZ9_9PSEU|nr:Gfo/Idh/MocA family oxidoreductase [Actinophytocola oryzae]TDV34225.1 NDP-hexose-3-ketoreductase [Actinophytocola oryzae]